VNDRVHVVDVAYSSHDLLKLGITERVWHRVTVLAGDANEAQCIAAQMVAATSGMPTRTRTVA
jgi:hypothetical protein